MEEITVTPEMEEITITPEMEEMDLMTPEMERSDDNSGTGGKR